MNSITHRFESLLAQSLEQQASDIHLSADRPIYLRRFGKLVLLDSPPWTGKAIDELLAEILHPSQKESFQVERSLDLAYQADQGPRYRLNVYYEKQRPTLAIRRIEQEVASFESLHLPPSLEKLTTITDGLVLITGPTGSGKSTTLNAIIDQINRLSPQHIITIEDPIEQVHDGAQCLIHQRELFTDVPSYRQGIKDALREDPDIILVGEMRDPDTMRTVIAAAETGHAVYSTLHTSDAVGAINRILGGFSAAEQASIRHQLSMVLRAVVSQRLVPTPAQDARIPIVEVLWGTKAVCNHIRTGRLEQIYTLMESGSQNGMMTREQSLAFHVTKGTVALDDALRLAKDPKVLIDLLRHISQRQGEVLPSGPTASADTAHSATEPEEAVQSATR